MFFARDRCELGSDTLFFAAVSGTRSQKLLFVLWCLLSLVCLLGVLDRVRGNYALSSPRCELALFSSLFARLCVHLMDAAITSVCGELARQDVNFLGNLIRGAIIAVIKRMFNAG